MRTGNGISGRGWVENSVHNTRGMGKSGLLASGSERSNVSSVRNGNGISGRGWERGRTENSVRKSRGKSGLLASGKHTSRYGGFSSNCNNNIKSSARKIGGWVKQKDVSSVRNFRSIRNGDNNKQGWVSERNDVSSVRNGNNNSKRG